MTRRPHMLGKVPADPARGRLLALIHIARKDLNLDVDDYRAVVLRVTGAPTCSEAPIPALMRLVEEFKRLGWKPKLPSCRTTDSGKPHVRKVYAIWNDMAPLLASGGTREALRAFVVRQTGVSAPEFLDGDQARLVIEALKAWKARLVREGACNG